MTNRRGIQNDQFKITAFQNDEQAGKKLFLAHRRVYIGKVINLDVTSRQTV
jgi:hypothetical protein